MNDEEVHGREFSQQISSIRTPMVRQLLPLCDAVAFCPCYLLIALLCSAEIAHCPHLADDLCICNSGHHAIDVAHPSQQMLEALAVAVVAVATVVVTVADLVGVVVAGPPGLKRHGLGTGPAPIATTSALPAGTYVHDLVTSSSYTLSHYASIDTLTCLLQLLVKYVVTQLT